MILNRMPAAPITSIIPSVLTGLLFLLAGEALAADPPSLLADATFEGGSLGPMTTANSAWEVQRNGANTTGFVVDEQTRRRQAFHFDSASV